MVFSVGHTAQQAVADGAHHRAGFAQQLAPLRQQLGGGGFAVGAGHADQTQTLARLVVKTPGQRGKALVQLAQVDHRHAVHFNDGAVFGLTVSFGDHGGDALRDGLRNIAASIRLMADNGDKQIPGSRHAAV